MDKQYNLEVLNANSLGAFRELIKVMCNEFLREKQKFNDEISEAINDANEKFILRYSQDTQTKIKKRDIACEANIMRGTYLSRLLDRENFEEIEEYRTCVKGDIKPIVQFFSLAQGFKVLLCFKKTWSFAPHAVLAFQHEAIKQAMPAIIR